MDRTRCNALKRVTASCADQVRNDEDLKVAYELLQKGNEAWVDAVVDRPAVHYHRDGQTAEICHRLFGTGCHERRYRCFGGRLRRRISRRIRSRHNRLGQGSTHSAKR